MSTREQPPVKVLIVDDHEIVRAGLRMLIGSHDGMIVVGEAGNRTEALAAAAREDPRIILLDLDLGEDSSLSFLRDLIASTTESRVLILTGVRDPEIHQQAVRLGAAGLVLKDKAPEVLLKAIEKVHAGEVWLDRSLTSSVLADLTDSRGAKPNDYEATKIATLTDREREIITLVSEGLKNKQIADRLFISEATVRNHLTSVLSKLDLTNRFELAIYAYRQKLAKPPE